MPGDCPDLITGSAPRPHPEGVTYAPGEKRFLVGSVTHGTVSAVRPDGSVRTLVDDPALIMTMGLAVHAARSTGSRSTARRAATSATTG